MKTSAQVAFETYSQSFGIDTPQIIRNQSTINGPIPWDQLDDGAKLRWKMIADAVARNDRDLALKEATDTIRELRAKQPTVSSEVKATTPPSETYVCSTCGASLMKGENHDCKAIVAHRRALGHTLPGDKQ